MGEQLDIQFSGGIGFSVFAHLEKAAITMDPFSVGTLSLGKGPSQGHLSTQKKVCVARNRKKVLLHFRQGEKNWSFQRRYTPTS